MYRGLSLQKGTLRLRVILGSSGEHANPEILVRMICLQFLLWTMPASPLRVVTESKAQFELTFHLPRLAAWTLHQMRRLHRLTGWNRLIPRILILRDPDWCASGRLHPLPLWLFQREVEYQESFVVPQAAEAEPAERQPVRWTGARPPSQTHLRLVVDNAPFVPHEEGREVHTDEIPWDFGGVGDIRGDGERTDPMQRTPSPTPTLVGRSGRPSPRRI